MPQLVRGRVIRLEVEEPLEISHGDSLTRTRPCCRIDQFGLAVVGGVVVELVVVDEADDEELEDEGRVVVVPGRVVVVVLAVVVVVVDSTTVGSAPFKMP